MPPPPPPLPTLPQPLELISFFLNTFNKYLFLAALGLHCCAWAFTSDGEWGLFSSCGMLVLIVGASLVAEHWL